MSDKHSFFLKLIRGIEGEAQRSEAAANIACDRVNSISKSLRASEQRHEKVLNSLKIAEAKAADLFLQQSKTRKKLFSLYSSLQSVLAKSIDNASALSSKKSVDSEVGTYHVGMTPLLWWRISVLYSFNVGNISDFTRHASLRKEAELLSRDGADGSHCDNIMPICQYFLLGTCLDEKCPYSHPSPHLGGTDVQAMKKSKDGHFAWILEKHRQYLSKFSEEQSHKNSSSQKSNAQNHDADQHILNSDSVQKGGNSDSTEIRSVREESLKKRDLSGRYFNEIHSNNLKGDSSMTNSGERSWAQRFIEQCNAALVKVIGTYEKAQGWMSADCNQFSSSSSDLPLSSTVIATIEQKLLSRFCFNLLYGFSYKNQKQRDICIRSCLQILKPYLDDFPSTSTSPSLTEAWKLFLILSLEGDIITPNICLQYWQKLVLHLEKLLSQSLSVQPLLAALCCRIADAAEDAGTETLSHVRTGVGTGTGTGAGVCKHYSVQSNPLKVLTALWELERMCDGGRTEVALEALCKNLLLPSPFQLSHQSSLDLQCLPRDIAFATFFVLILTGQFIGRKLFYSRDALLLMTDEINTIAGSRVRNLFRRCPFLREFVRDAFLTCFRSLNAFRHFGTVVIDMYGGCSEGLSHLSESSTVTANSGECDAPTAPLSSVDQTIIWCYLLLLHCATGEDQVSLKPYQLEDVHRFCDILCYPGVYEGAAALTSASSDRSSAHRSDLHSALGMSTVAVEHSSTPSNTASPSPSSSSSLSVRLMLMSALDSYLLSADCSTASLESALFAAHPMADNATHPSLPQVELNVDTLVSELWSTLDYLSHPASSLDVVCVLGTWTVKLSRSKTLSTASHISRFTTDFAALCRSYLDEKKNRFSAALFLNILSSQVLMVAKSACSNSRDHSTSVHLIEMVLAINELTLRIEQSISDTEGAGAEAEAVEGNAADCLDSNSIGKGREKEKEIPEVMRKRKRGGIELPVQAAIGPSSGDTMQWGDIPSIDCCTAELDCVGPTSQTRLLTRTLDLLDAHGMMSYNIVELLFQRAAPLRGSADLLVQWILDWFRDSSTQQDRRDDPESAPNAEQGRGVVSSDMIPPSTSLKDSILIATAFQNSRCVSSLSFLRRLSPRSLFQLSFHFLRAENFILFSTVESLLDGNSSYKVLLRSFCEVDSLSRQIVEYKSRSSTKNRDREIDKAKDRDRDVSDDALRECRWTLSENLDFLSSESDSMLQSFQEGLSEYQLNGKRTLDFSRFIPEELSVPVGVSVHVSVRSFPFQSIALFSERLLVLDISNNFLTVFPPALLFFFQLQKLNLSHNKIQSLPQQLGTHLSDLQNLDLTDNKFCVFPACVLNMKTLEELRLGMNSLEYLPLQVKSLAKLQHLDISNNKFKVLSSDLTHIRFLKT